MALDLRDTTKFPRTATLAADATNIDNLLFIFNMFIPYNILSI